MAKKTMVSSNTINWEAKDIRSLDCVKVSVGELALATRRVVLRFADGPSIDLSIYDMDRLVIAYLKMRGVKLPAHFEDFAKTAPTPAGELIPSQLVAKTRRDTDVVKRLCARCRERKCDSDDWYGELCPECADATDGDWHCRRCRRTGNYEEMGGSGANRPRCCGLLCKRVSTQG